VCSAEVLPLMMVPGIKSWWAACLYDNGEGM
jgi:hypothetical protein